ncbi:type II secretion system protein N [Pseudomonas fluorescens]|nr:type II secretion system protein N [Pseudomonas fluorescens]
MSEFRAKRLPQAIAVMLPRVSSTSLLMVPIAYLAFLAWQEWRFRDEFTGPPPVISAIAPSLVREPLNTAAIASVLGLTTAVSPLPSAEPLTLHASFIHSNGLSKALLADAQGPRMYEVGERLPGGSVLRRVEVTQVVLWNKGREEVLALVPSSASFLRAFQVPKQSLAPAISTRFLRPVSGQSE